MSKLLTFWTQACQLLGLQLVAPFVLKTKSGAEIKAIALIKDFGAPMGMMILDDYSKVEEIIDEITEMGYGFSVLDEPLEHEGFDIADYKDVLKDWGWSGANESKPEWLKESCDSSS